jgi:putative ABC transport system permease protein
MIGVPQAGEYSLNAYNATDITAGQRAMTLAIRLFIFGFVALLTLIAVTNIVSTVVTNMRLRNRDFALLRAVGMSKRNFAKMLRFENFLSSVRALLIGIPLGSAFVLVLHFGFMQSGEFPFSYPWLAAVISAVGVLVIVFSAAMIAERKIGNLSVVEALRE